MKTDKPINEEVFYKAKLKEVLSDGSLSADAINNCLAKYELLAAKSFPAHAYKTIANEFGPQEITENDLIQADKELKECRASIFSTFIEMKLEDANKNKIDNIDSATSFYNRGGGDRTEFYKKKFGFKAARLQLESDIDNAPKPQIEATASTQFKGKKVSMALVIKK